MKINDITGALPPEVKRVERPVKKGSAAADVVAISPRAVEMQEAIETAKNAPDIRAEKALMLKEEIGKGMYRVRGSNVAGKLIESALE